MGLSREDGFDLGYYERTASPRFAVLLVAICFFSLCAAVVLMAL